MSVAKRLIVNADGFAFGPGATQGIIDAIKEGGAITSVSVNANFPEVERVREIVADFPNISIGVHLNPMVGRPCLPPDRVPSLVGPDGHFLNEEFPKLLRTGSISMAELEAEFDAQIGTVKALAGERLTHLDSQENRHMSYFDLFLRLAQRWEIERMRNNASIICLETPQPRLSRLKAYVRKPHVFLGHQYRKYQMWNARRAGMRMADDLVTIGYGGLWQSRAKRQSREWYKDNPENWVRVLRNLPPGTHEVYCHPGYPDPTLRAWSHMVESRGKELEIFRSPELRSLSKEVGVELISFDQI